MAYLELVDSPLVFKTPRSRDAEHAAEADMTVEPEAEETEAEEPASWSPPPRLNPRLEAASGTTRQPTGRAWSRSQRRARWRGRRGCSAGGGSDDAPSAEAPLRRGLAQAVAPSAALTATITAPASETAPSEVVKLVPKKRARRMASAISSSVTTTNAVSSATW